MATHSKTFCSSYGVTFLTAKDFSTQPRRRVSGSTRAMCRTSTTCRRCSSCSRKTQTFRRCFVTQWRRRGRRFSDNFCGCRCGVFTHSFRFTFVANGSRFGGKSAGTCSSVRQTCAGNGGYFVTTCFTDVTSLPDTIIFDQNFL